MKKNLMLIGVTIAALTVANCKEKTPAAAAEGSKAAKWDCKFTGSYKEKDGGVGSFTWNVVWAETGDTSVITGGGKDEGGESTANGTCVKHDCKISEEYTAGKEKGKKGYWAFTYTDAETKNENVFVTVLTGTYGPSEADRTSLGALNAKADCKAMP